MNLEMCTDFDDALLRVNIVRGVHFSLYINYVVYIWFYRVFRQLREIKIC